MITKNIPSASYNRIQFHIQIFKEGCPTDDYPGEVSSFKQICHQLSSTWLVCFFHLTKFLIKLLRPIISICIYIIVNKLFIIHCKYIIKPNNVVWECFLITILKLAISSNYFFTQFKVYNLNNFFNVFSLLFTF